MDSVEIYLPDLEIENDIREELVDFNNSSGKEPLDIKAITNKTPSYMSKKIKGEQTSRIGWMLCNGPVRLGLNKKS